MQAGDPPLVFALGSSAVWVAGDFWRHAVAASRAFGYLPYSMVFPRAAAVVHQAGIGTLSQALRAGRPQLIVPFAFDQPDNALRASRLGLARVLPLKKLDASSLRRELDALLSAKDYEHRASRVARELRDVNGAERAAQELSTLMESR